MSSTAKGYLIAFVGIAFWSTTGIFIGYLLKNFSLTPVTLAFWRNVFVCVALAPIIAAVRPALLRIRASEIGYYAAYGLTLALFNTIWATSVKTNGAAVATVLAYSSAGFTAVFALWAFKESLRVPKMLAVVLSLSGCVMVANALSASAWRLNALGAATGLLSGLFFAGYSLFGRDAARRSINPWSGMLHSFAFAALFILIIDLMPGVPGAAGSLHGVVPTLPARGWLILAALSFVPTIIGFGLYNLSMTYLPASVANILATLEPPMTCVQAYLLLHERMTLLQIVGGIVILSAVFIIQFERAPDRRDASVNAAS